MKTKLIFILSLLIAFSGCNKIKDSLTIPVSTNLKTSVQVIVVPAAKKSLDLLGAAAVSSFTKTQEISLTDNTDVAPYVEKIKSIDVNSLLITITGLTQGQTINSVALDIAGVGNVFTQTNITMTNNSFTPSISQTTLNSVAAKLTSDKKLTLTLSGNTSGAMTFTVSLNFDVVVTAYVL